MIDHEKFTQSLIVVVLSVCFTGLMTWLGWLTVVVFDHTKVAARIEYLEDEIDKLKFR